MHVRKYSPSELDDVAKSVLGFVYSWFFNRVSKGEWVIMGRLEDLEAKIEADNAEILSKVDGLEVFVEGQFDVIKAQQQEIADLLASGDISQLAFDRLMAKAEANKAALQAKLDAVSVDDEPPVVELPPAEDLGIEEPVVEEPIDGEDIEVVVDPEVDPV